MDQTREGSQAKRKKISDEERIRRCRERNRVHARNTRERKKHQMDELRQRIETLTKEKSKLKKNVVESSVADILVSLSTDNASNNEVTGKRRKTKKFAAGSSSSQGGGESDGSSMLSEYGSDQPITVQQIRRRISATTNEEEKAKSPQGSAAMETAFSPSADPEDIERMRRERNKLHARKTRVRKKKLMHEMERIVSHLEDEVETLRSRSGTLVEEVDTPHGVDLHVRTEAGESSGTEMNAGASVLASSFKLMSEEEVPPASGAGAASSSSSSGGAGGGGRTLREKKPRVASVIATNSRTSLLDPAEDEAVSSSSTRARSASRNSNDLEGSQGSGSGEGSSTKTTNRTSSTTGTNGTTGEAGDTSDSKLSTSTGSSRTGHAQSLLSIASNGAKKSPKKRKKGGMAMASDMADVHHGEQQDSQQQAHNDLGTFTSMSVPKRRRVSGPSPSNKNPMGSHGGHSHDEEGGDLSGDTSAGQAGDEGGGSGSGSGSEKDFEDGASGRGRSRRGGRQGGPSKPFTVPSFAGSSGAGADTGAMDNTSGGSGDYSKLSIESLERHNQRKR